MTTTTTTTYTSDEFAKLAYSDQLGLSRRGKVMAASILADTDPAKAAQALFVAFRGPYLIAKTGGRAHEVKLWAKAWNGSSAALVSPLREGGFKAFWPDLRNGLTRKGGDTVELLTVTEAADAAKQEKIDAVERDAKARADFMEQETEKRQEAALALSLDELVAQIAAAVGETSHGLSTVVTELGKLVKLAEPATKVRPASKAADKAVSA